MLDGASASLDRFLSPAAIAIIGASPDITKIRGRLLHLLRENGYRGKFIVPLPVPSGGVLLVEACGTAKIALSAVDAT